MFVRYEVLIILSSTSNFPRSIASKVYEVRGTRYEVLIILSSTSNFPRSIASKDAELAFSTTTKK